MDAIVASLHEAIDLDNPAKTLSTLLSFGIIAGSFALKIPQIINMIRAGNARGVSLFSNLVDATGFAVSASWGYSQGLPLKTFGESVTILVQLYIVCLLIGVYNGGAQLFVVFIALAAISAFGYALAMGFVPVNVHEGLMGLQIIFAAVSRVPQIIMNQKNKSTGVLSFVTFFLSFGGAAARAFTTLVSVPMEKGKLVMFATSLTSCALNGLIVAQILIYGNKKQKMDDDFNSSLTNNQGVARKTAAATTTTTTDAAGRSSRQSRKSI